MNLRIFLIIISLVTPTLVQAKDKLKFGYVLYPPLVVIGEHDRPAGEVIDLVEQTLSSEFEIEWIRLPIGRVKWGLENNIIDAFALYSYTPEREIYVRYLSKPLLTIQSELCSKMLTGKSFNSETDLLDEIDGKVVISVLNSATFPYSENNRIRHLKIPYDDYNERGFALLTESRADYIFFPIGSVFDDKIKKNKMSCVDIGKAQPIYIAFSTGSQKAPRVEAKFRSVDILNY